MTDESFEPRLGRLRAGGGKRARKYLGRVVAAVARAGDKTGTRSRRFDGSRIGRGASIGRVLHGGDRHAAARARRVVIKTRLVKLGFKGISAARAHLRYIQRDGVGADGAPGGLYSADADVADGKAFVERGTGDRHQFRFIVSAEDGDQYPDLKPFVRRLMAQMEEDLGTKLDWVAADHRDTGHPHTHIMLRGKDDRGENLVIAREYIARGMCERASALATLDLGPRTDLEIEERLRHDIGAERLTPIDRHLIRDMDGERTVSSADRDPFQQSLRAGRLKTLERLGLADDLGAGRWQLADTLEDNLRDIGERGDIIRTMQRELTAHQLDRAPADCVIHGAGDPQPIVGRVVARGLSDELHDRHYLIVDGVDGRSHYIGIGRGDAVEPLPEGAIVRVQPQSGGVREVDRTIAAVAAANGGRYDVDAHLRHDPQASEAFAESHVRRLEAMRRLTRSVEREPDGRWIIAPDHLDRVATFEARVTADRPVTVEMLSSVPLDRLTRANAATWLDRELTAAKPIPLRDAGFEAQLFIFDKGFSARAAVLAMGGAHHALGLGEDGLAFQPLRCIADPAERAWAADWIAALFDHEKVAVTPQVKDAIWSALASLASAPEDERTLTGLALLLQSNALRAALAPYTLDGPFGRLLDSVEPDQGFANVQCFETEALMGRAGVVAPVLTYLFHRLEERFDGRPTLLILDEAWIFLDHPLFGARIREWLKVLRKKNVAVLFATQSLADIAASSIAPAIIESCPQRILLPNDRAIEPQSRAAYERFGLNDRQIELIARATHKRHYYLQSARGNRLFELGLGPVALAFCGASDPASQARIDAILAEQASTRADDLASDANDDFAARFLIDRDLAWAASALAGFGN